MKFTRDGLFFLKDGVRVAGVVPNDISIDEISGIIIGLFDISEKEFYRLLEEADDSSYKKLCDVLDEQNKMLKELLKITKGN